MCLLRGERERTKERVPTLVLLLLLPLELVEQEVAGTTKEVDDQTEAARRATATTTTICKKDGTHLAMITIKSYTLTGNLKRVLKCRSCFVAC